MKVYIQKDIDIPPHCAIAAFGFRKKGYEIEYFSPSYLPQADKDTIVVAGIPVLNKVLAAAGIDPSSLENIPKILTKFTGRKTWRGTMGEARENYPVFIKPVEKEWKMFTGYVIRDYKDLIPTAGLDEKHEIILSEVMDFVSEYRCFVCEGEILGVSHYKGDFRKCINFSVVERAVVDFENAPAAYSLDFGLDKEGYTFLVEVNDALALGPYGLSPLYYATMIEKRWEELFKYE